MTQETVFIAKNNKSARDLGFEIMEMIGTDFRGKKVLIKPNLTIRALPDSGIITNPIFCEGIIDYLKKSGVSDIKIGEGTSDAPDDEMNEVYKATGFFDLSLKTGVGLININKDEVVEIEVPNPIIWKTVKVARSILDFDVLINIPVLKTHHIAITTLGIKNLMGLFLPVEERHDKFHEKLDFLRENAKKEGRENLNKEEFKQAHVEISEKILDLYKAISSKIKIITVIDGFYGRDGDGLEIGETKSMGIAIAGKNTVAVDTIGAYIMGFNPRLIYYLSLAQKEKLGLSQLSKIKIKGINPKTIRTKFNVLGA